MSEPIYSRAPDVVWRLGPDRVLVRRAGAEDASADLLGAAALVWVALDQPGTRNEIVVRIASGGLRTDADVAINQLVAAEWILQRI